MPVQYTIDEPSNLVRTTATGQFTLAEYLAHIARIDGDARARACRGELVDLTGVTSLNFSFRATRAAIAASRENQSDWPADYRLAIVASRKLVFAAARMYEILSTGAPWEVQVFRDLAEAENWLQPGDQIEST